MKVAWLPVTVFLLAFVNTMASSNEEFDSISKRSNKMNVQSDGDRDNKIHNILVQFCTS
jgi:hypothetical protein